MIDFKKLNTPEARESSKKWREELEQKFAAKEASQKRMIAHLQEQVEAGESTNDWELEFIGSIGYRLNAFGTLTDKQDAVLTRLFEKY